MSHYISFAQNLFPYLSPYLLSAARIPRNVGLLASECSQEHIKANF